MFRARWRAIRIYSIPTRLADRFSLSHSSIPIFYMLMSCPYEEGHSDRECPRYTPSLASCSYTIHSISVSMHSLCSEAAHRRHGSLLIGSTAGHDQAQNEAYSHDIRTIVHVMTEGAKHLGDERDVEITSPGNGEAGDLSGDMIVIVGYLLGTRTVWADWQRLCQTFGCRTRRQ